MDCFLVPFCVLYIQVGEVLKHGTFAFTFLPRNCDFFNGFKHPTNLKISVPGTEVPRATKAMALTESLRKMKQPRWPATSPMTAVQRPMKAIEMTKQGYPLPMPIYYFIIKIMVFKLYVYIPNCSPIPNTSNSYRLQFVKS